MKIYRGLLGILAAFGLFIISTTPVCAAETASDFDAEKYVTEELNAYAERMGKGITFDGFSYTTDMDMTSEAIETSIRDYVDMMKTAIDGMEVNLVPMASPRATKSYTASVESLIPAIGWGYINQDFKANVSSSKISSITLVGSSYDTGFTLGSWEPNYSWYVISNNKQYCQIYMKGTINYLWDALNISQACTFLDTFKASGSSLVKSTYLDWPD